MLARGYSFMYGLSYQLAAEQFQQLSPTSRVIVIHPTFARQHVILASLLDDAGSVYVRFDGRNLTRAQLDAQLQAALQAQNNQAGLADVRQLLLDECDCAQPEALDALLTDVLDRMPVGRVIVWTRHPPHALLENDNLRGQMSFVPVDESLMLWDYAQRNGEKKVLLEVRALGTGRVLRDGKSVDNWDGLLPRSLFFYLVDKGMTTRNDIFNTFWPNLSVREATNVFHVTKRKISEVLGTDLTVYWSGFYHISPDIEL